MEENVQALLFEILRQVLCLVAIPTIGELQQEEFDALMALAKKHGLLPVIAYGLLQNGKLTSSQEDACRKSVYRAMAYQQRMEQDLKRTCNLFEREKIAYMPLKGAVIRSFYPEPWLRTSGDIDILVQDVERAVALLEEAGYHKKETDAHEVTFISPGGIVLELHFLLIETDVRVNSVLEKVWDDAISQTGSCRYAMEPEMFYYYHIAHMAKHMVQGGCGIRFFADLWLLNKGFVMKAERKRQLLREGGLEKFAEKAERLSRVWFDQEQPDALVLELERFVLSGGTFGSKSNMVKLHRTKSRTALGFSFRRIFPEYKQMSIHSLMLRKYPVLLPIFWVRRWVQLIMHPERIRGAMRELELNKTLDVDAVSSTERLFKKLGLS